MRPPMVGIKTWTNEQLATLSQRYMTDSVETVALLTGHTRPAVAAKMRDLGLKKPFKTILQMKDIQLSERNLGYLAGLIDGEGTVTIRKSSGRKTKTKFYAHVFISNTSMPLLTHLKAMIPASGIYLDEPHNNKAGRLDLKGLTFYKLFKQLEPLLVVKRMQMSVLLLWIESRLENWTYEGYSEHEMELVAAIRWLNLRGSARSARGPLPPALSSITSELGLGPT